MSEQRLGPAGGGRLPATAAEAVEALQALVMGEADALVVETAHGPRVFTLRDASEPYRQLIESMSQAVAVLNDGVVVYCNGGISRAIGGGSTFGEIMADFVVAEDRPRFDVFLREGARAQVSCEAALRRAEGSPLATRMAAAPLDFDGVSCVALVVTPLEDIASWKTARSGLLESERRFRVALGNSPVAAFEQDLSLRYTWIFNSKLGLSAQDVLGRTDAELLDPSCAPRLEQIKRAVIGSGQPVRAEVGVAAPGGPVETFDLYVEPRRDASGAITGVVCAATEITERKQAEDALRENEAALRRAKRQLRHAADAARLTYVEFDLDHQRVELAENYANVLGPEPEIDGAGMAQAFERLLGDIDAEDRSRLLEAHEAFFAGLDPEPAPYRVKAGDGGERWIESRWSAEFSADGRPARVFVSKLDVTKLIEGKAALAAAKAEAERANLAKSRFLAAASHDLRQPVQSLVLLLPLLERHINPTPKAAQVLNLMSKALGGLNVLLTAVLDVSRLDAGGIEPALEIVPLSGLCERLVAEYGPKASACGLDLRVRTLDLCARTDPVLLERVLRNLIENALRYTRAGGVLLAMRRRGKNTRIDVIDTGVGIPEAKQPEIFQEFTQLDNPGRDLSKGLGLGLAIVSRISALLDLDLAVASRPSRGSRFSVSLAVAEPAAPRAAPESASAPQSGSVLVIEDNQILRLAIETILSESGYDTLAAASGEEAVALVNARRPLDAIVTDYRLGAGLNGVEAAREIERRLGRKLPKLLLTGEAGDRRFEQVDFTSFEFLYKPISAEKLLAKLAAMMRARTFSCEADANSR